MGGRRPVRIGTRGSALALAQTGWVAEALRRANPGLSFRLVVIRTTGDKMKASALSAIGGKGLFTKEIEDALLADKIDVAVHSLKDLPTDLPAGLEIVAVPEREDPCDCLISKRGWSLLSVPKGARIGAGALRRKAQALALRPDLQVLDIRGNLDTRLAKLESGMYDAILVACAGLKRLGRSKPLPRGLKARRVPAGAILPAVGQGALALEARAGARAGAALRRLDHARSHREVLCERSFLKVLQGGCQVPAGACAKIQGRRLRLDGLIASPDGKRALRGRLSGNASDALKIGEDLAKRLLDRGGREILAGIQR